MLVFSPRCFVLVVAGTPAAQASDDGTMLQRAGAFLHEKGSKTLANAAQDRTFSDASTHDRHHKHTPKAEFDDISLNVRSRYRVEEICPIDPNCLAISCIGGQEIEHDLSHQEASARFHRSGFRHRPSAVYVSPVRTSVDT